MYLRGRAPGLSCLPRCLCCSLPWCNPYFSSQNCVQSFMLRRCLTCSVFPQDHATEYDYVVRRITEAHGLIRQAAGIDVRLDREVAKLEVQILCPWAWAGLHMLWSG